MNPVLLSVLAVLLLSLLKVNVVVALLVAALVGGLTGGMTLPDTMKILIGGMGGNAETALSYILLGALAVAIAETGITSLLVRSAVTRLQKARTAALLPCISPSFRYRFHPCCPSLTGSTSTGVAWPAP